MAAKKAEAWNERQVRVITKALTPRQTQEVQRIVSADGSRLSIGGEGVDARVFAGLERKGILKRAGRGGAFATFTANGRKIAQAVLEAEQASAESAESDE